MVLNLIRQSYLIGKWFLISRLSSLVIFILSELTARLVELVNIFLKVLNRNFTMKTLIIRRALTVVEVYLRRLFLFHYHLSFDLLENWHLRRGFLDNSVYGRHMVIINDKKLSFNLLGYSIVYR